MPEGVEGQDSGSKTTPDRGPGQMIASVLLLETGADEGPLREILAAAQLRGALTRVATIGEFVHALDVSHDLILALAAQTDRGLVIDALRSWRRIAPKTPFLVLTMPGAEEIGGACARDGAGVIPIESAGRAATLLLGPQGAPETPDEKQRLVSEAERVAPVADLVSHIAHEVKNPLTMIVMGIEYLRRRLEGADLEIQSVLDDMRDAVNQANAAVRGASDLAKNGSLELRVEAINAVVEEVLTSMAVPLRSRAIRVAKDLNPDLPPVRLDRGRMLLVISRVVQHSIERVPDGGDIWVRTSPLRCPTGETVDDRVVVLEIEDSGPSLSETEIDRIFDPVRPSDPDGRDARQDLSSVFEIVGQHGGVVTAWNRKGARGLQISISLRAAGTG